MKTKAIVALIASLVMSVQSLSAGKTYVVAFGIDDYQYGWQDNVGMCVNDVRAMADIFFSRSADTDVFLLLNKNATRDHILRVLKAKCDQAKSDDEIIFIICTHGADGFITTYKRNEFIYNYEIQNILKESKAGCKLIITDSCHSGSMAKKYKGNKKKKAEPNNANVVLFLASRPDEYSCGNAFMPNSFFFSCLKDGLQGEADANGDGNITIRELFNYVYPKVVNLAAKQGDSQHPQILGKFHDDMIIFKLKP